MAGSKDKALADILDIQKCSLLTPTAADWLCGLAVRGVMNAYFPGVLRKLQKVGLEPGKTT